MSTPEAALTHTPMMHGSVEPITAALSEHFDFHTTLHATLK